MSDEIDISNSLEDLDLTSVDTNLPILCPVITEVTVTEAKIEENSKGTGNNLNLKLQTTEPLEAENRDEPVAPGFPLYHTISLVQTEKYDPRRNLAAFQEAVLGEKKAGFRVEEVIGETVTVKIKPEGTEESEYGRQNRINRFLKS